MEVEEDQWKELPAFVILNPNQEAMFYDPDRSGMHLAQWGGTDKDGNEIRNYGVVPKSNDCSGIKMALDAGILFQCNPKGECRHIPAPIIKEDSMEDLMGKNTRELTALLPHISDPEFLAKMRDFEEGKPRKEIRLPFLRDLRARQKEVDGPLQIRAEQAMIDDGTGKMIPDSVRVTR